MPVDKGDAVEKLALLIERLRSRYSFGYAPLNTSRDGKFRRIRLSVTPGVEKREGKLVISTRNGYRAPKDEPENAAPALKPKSPER